MLRSLGVSDDAANVYHALVAKPDIGLADLLARSGLAEREFGEAVTELARLGLIEPTGTSLAGETVLRLADPELAFSASLRQREADLARQQQELADAKAAIAAAAAAHPASAGHSARCARLIASEQDTLNVTRQVITGSTDECLIALADPPGTLGEAGTLLAGIAARGVRVAVLCADAARSSPGRANLDHLERAGAQVCTLPMITNSDRRQPSGSPHPRTGRTWRTPHLAEQAGAPATTPGLDRHDRPATGTRPGGRKPRRAHRQTGNKPQHPPCSGQPRRLRPTRRHRR